MESFCPFLLEFSWSSGNLKENLVASHGKQALLLIEYYHINIFCFFAGLLHCDCGYVILISLYLIA